MSPLSKHQPVRMRLTQSQVRHVVREASGGVGQATLLSTISGVEELQRALVPLMDDERYSRATICALLVLAALPTDGAGREVTDVARQLGMAPSTAHRYMATWMAIGSIEQDSSSRRYWRPPTVSRYRSD